MANEPPSDAHRRLIDAALALDAVSGTWRVSANAVVVREFVLACQAVRDLERDEIPWLHEDEPDRWNITDRD